MGLTIFANIVFSADKSIASAAIFEASSFSEPTTSSQLMSYPASLAILVQNTLCVRPLPSRNGCI